MRAGVDICNTIANINACVAEALGLPVEALTRKYGLEHLGLDSAGWFQAHPEVYEAALPMPVIYDEVRALARAGWEIVYVTSRPERHRAVTTRWLRRWGFPTGDLIMNGNKAEVAQALGLALFLEDSPNEIRALRKVCRVRVVPWPYNESLRRRG